MGRRTRRERSRRRPARALAPRQSGKATSGFSVDRGEGFWVVVILACGGLLRLALPENMAVEHFDEGVYASNLWFTKELGYQFHLRHLYAPPLLPSLIEAALVAEQLLLRPGARPSSLAVMAPGLLAGCATGVLVWWSTRSWFGRVPALAAMSLWALSDMHALYARTALTDVLLVFWLLLAVWLAVRALAVGRPQWILVAGLATALAWWTKYNGWLPLTIMLSGLLVAAVFDVTVRDQLWRSLGRWLAVAAVTLACWSPCLYLLQGEGGYAAVAANHRQYITGLAGWPSGFLQQAANLRHFDGWITCLGLALAVLVACWQLGWSERDDASRSRTVAGRWLACFALAVSLAGLAAWLGSAPVLLLLGLYGMVSWLVWRRGGAGQADLSTLPAWVLLVWLVGLCLVTPLYHPYPRLTLPWLCASWMAAGLGIDRLLRVLVRVSSERRFTAPAITCLLVAVSALAAAGHHLAPRGVPAWRPRTGLSQTVDKIAAAVQRDLAQQGAPGGSEVVFVYGEPGLFYHLRAATELSVAPIGDLGVVASFDAPNTLKYLVTGPHAEHSRQFTEQFTRVRDLYEPIRSLSFPSSDLVLLNRYHPRELDADAATRRSEVRVYRSR